MRTAEPSDADALEGLEHRLFPENCFNSHTLKNELSIGKCWVKEENGEVIGYLLARVEQGVMDILRLGVRDDHQRKGIATALLRAAFEESPGVTMLTAKRYNQVALRLYLKMGFRIVGTLDCDAGWILKRG